MKTPRTPSTESRDRDWSENYREKLWKHPSLSTGAWILLVIRGVFQEGGKIRATIPGVLMRKVRKGLLVISARLIGERVRRES